MAREDEGKSLDQSKTLEQRVIRSDKGRFNQQIFYIFAFFVFFIYLALLINMFSFFFVLTFFHNALVLAVKYCVRTNPTLLCICSF